jgi:predicted negative regulator of RcsB-dependent stress response
MSSHTKSIIIGVVVGIVGAALLGVIAVVAWRYWGKNKKQHDQFKDYDPETSVNGSSENSKFNATLEQYHNPANVNQASNF